jgi:exonuclease III
VAHKPIDIDDPEKNAGHAGFTDAERDDLTRLLDSGFVDTFRYLHPTEADVYDAPSVTELTLALHNAGCEVKNIHEHDESLESYYMNLVGGAVDD